MSLHELLVCSGHDTVGAVALDCSGNLACATSTGGITAQMAGRVSDSPIGGSGGYADNQSGEWKDKSRNSCIETTPSYCDVMLAVAVSTTGHGESIMKVNLARMISFLVESGKCCVGDGGGSAR